MWSNVQYECTSGRRQGTGTPTPIHHRCNQVDRTFKLMWTFKPSDFASRSPFNSFNVVTVLMHPRRMTPYEAAELTAVEGVASAPRCCHRRVCSFWQNISLWNLLAIHLLRHTKHSPLLCSTTPPYLHPHAGLNRPKPLQANSKPLMPAVFI